jgi:hypothetical protein
MKRRNFLQATTALPFFANGIFGRDLLAGDGIHYSSNITDCQIPVNPISFIGCPTPGLVILFLHTIMGSFSYCIWLTGVTNKITVNVFPGIEYLLLTL